MMKTFNDYHVEKLHEILDKKLFNNDINIVTKILGYLTKKCKCCEEISLIEDLEKIEVPQQMWGCEKHKRNNPDIYLCSVCRDENVCKDCEEYCCDDCDNKWSCEDCRTVYCEDCEGENLFWCGDCEEKSCCREVYKINDNAGDVIYRCNECLKCISH